MLLDCLVSENRNILQMVLLLCQRKRQNWGPEVTGRWRRPEGTVESGGGGVENQEGGDWRSERLAPHGRPHLVPLPGTVMRRGVKPWAPAGPSRAEAPPAAVTRGLTPRHPAGSRPWPPLQSQRQQARPVARPPRENRAEFRPASLAEGCLARGREGVPAGPNDPDGAESR